MKMNNTTDFPPTAGELVIPSDKSVYNPQKGLVIVHVIVLVILCVAAIIGNSIVINVVLRDRRLHMPTFYFVVNLAVADILTSLIYIPFYIVAIVEQRWIFEKTLCHVHIFFISMGINASLITLSFISFDRFLDIVFPFTYLLKMTSRRMRLIIVFSWVHSIFWALGPLYGWGEYIYDGASNTCRPNYSTGEWKHKSYVICLVTLCFVLPILLMFYCYIRIFTVVEKHAKDINEQVSCSVASLASIDISPKHSPKTIVKHSTKLESSPIHSPKAIANHSPQLEIPTEAIHEVRKTRDLRAHKMILMITVIFIICWAPYTIVVMQRLVGENTSETYWSVNCGLTFALLTTAVNPLVYSTRDRRFKRGFKKVFSAIFWKSSKSPINV